MASTISIPTQGQLGNYPPKIVEQLIAQLTAAKTDIEALQAGSTIAATAQVGSRRTVRGIVFNNVASLAAFTVTGNAYDDGLTYVAGDRVLLVGQSTASQNGIYVVGTVASTTAPLTLATDWASTSVQPAGIEVKALEGTAWAGFTWFASLVTPITVGTSAPAFYPKEYWGTSGALSGTPGVKAISSLWILSATKTTVELTRRAAAGTPGHLSFETLTAGAGSGAFTITSTGNETSTVDYVIKNRA